MNCSGNKSYRSYRSSVRGVVSTVCAGGRWKVEGGRWKAVLIGKLCRDQSKTKETDGDDWSGGAEIRLHL